MYIFKRRHNRNHTAQRLFAKVVGFRCWGLCQNPCTWLHLLFSTAGLGFLWASGLSRKEGPDWWVCISRAPGLLGGSWVVISGVTSPLMWVISIVTLLITPLNLGLQIAQSRSYFIDFRPQSRYHLHTWSPWVIATHEPPSWVERVGQLRVPKNRQP